MDLELRPRPSLTSPRVCRLGLNRVLDAGRRLGLLWLASVIKSIPQPLEKRFAVEILYLNTGKLESINVLVGSFAARAAGPSESGLPHLAHRVGGVVDSTPERVRKA